MTVRHRDTNLTRCRQSWRERSEGEASSLLSDRSSFISQFQKVVGKFYLLENLRIVLGTTMGAIFFNLRPSPNIRPFFLEKKRRQWSKHRPRREKIFQIHNDYKVAHDSFPHSLHSLAKMLLSWEVVILRRLEFLKWLWTKNRVPLTLLLLYLQHTMRITIVHNRMSFTIVHK